MESEATAGEQFQTGSIAHSEQSISTPNPQAATASTEAKVRKQDPSYTVFKQNEDRAGGEHWHRIAEGVKASSREKAVASATAEEGTFLVVPDQQIKKLSRKVQQVVKDEFI
jgi:hypothetical protein